MTTGLDLVAECKRYLFSGTKEPLNRLTASIDTDDVNLVFDFSIGGIKEGATIAVDLELMHVWSAADNSNSAVVQRAILGSTAAAHDAQSVVTVNPKFSDFSIFQAINADLYDLSSPLNGLFKVSSVELTYNPSEEGYNLTGVTDILDVYEVRYETTGPWKDWPIIDRDLWEFRRVSETDDFASGYQLLLKGGGQAGRQLRVIYKAPFSPLTALANDVQTVTGLPASANDIPPLGAAIRLGSVREIPRNFNEIQGETRRADEVPAGANNAAIRGLLLMRDSRLRAEAARLAQAYPTRRY